MSHQYNYGQQVYDTDNINYQNEYTTDEFGNIQYQTEGQVNIQNIEGLEGIEGSNFGTYQMTNYQQPKTAKVISLPPISYDTYNNNEELFLNQIENQMKNQTEILPNQYNYIKQEQKNVNTYTYNTTTGIEDLNNQQYQVYDTQIIENKTKEIKPNIQYKPKTVVTPIQNMPQQIKYNNPNMQVQYKQNIPQQFQNSVKPQIIPNQVNNNQIPKMEHSAFDDEQYNIPLANSIITQSQIHVVPKNEQNKQGQNPPQVQPNPPQIQPNPPQVSQKISTSNSSFVKPIRNPNLNIPKYNYDEHFVISEDPGTSTIKKTNNMMSNLNLNNQDINNNINKIANESSLPKIEEKDSGVIEENKNVNQENLLDTNQSKEIKMSENKNILNSEIKPEESMNKQLTSEINQENTIQEKFPEANNINNDLNNINQNNDQNLSVQNNNEQLDEEIDDKLKTLPTIGNIMKGIEKMLPPPRRQKYQF